jgi:heme-degrading monooxygenase HmoA
MICVMTRFRLNHVWHLVSMYRALRSMRADLDAAPGLVRHAFLVEAPRTCYTLSIWESEAALERFINMRSHIAALRRARRWCRDIWSGYWPLAAVSRSAQQWPGRAPWPVLVAHPTHPNRLVPVADSDGGITPALEPRCARAVADLPHK